MRRQGSHQATVPYLSVRRVLFIILLLPVIVVLINLFAATSRPKEDPDQNSKKLNQRDSGSTWLTGEEPLENNGAIPLPGMEGETGASSLKLETPDTKTKSNSGGNSNGKKKIAYAITVTKDGHFADGALVLGHSAKKVHDASQGFNSEYEAELVAFVVPSVVTSRTILAAYGWRILERTLPVPLEEIENQDYAMKMKNSGCCGADEFLKLWAYTLTEYHRVVHLDMDSVIFQNMDELYSLDKEMLYTGDYNMKGGSPVAPAQGGFLVVRPSMERFKEFQAIIKKGDHTGRGWGGSRIGNFWGGQTIQGIVPYFYYSIHPGDAMELNRCEYNCMVDNPYRPFTEICLDGQKTCQDCRLQVPEKVKSAHFTICQKPWTCTEHLNPKNKVLCEALHKKWFQLRDELETSTGVDKSYRIPSRYKDSMGMCKRYGDSGYLPIPLTLVKK